MQSSRFSTINGLFVLALVAFPAHSQEKEPSYQRIDEPTVAAYNKIGAAFVVQRGGRLPVICFSGFRERKLDLSKKFPDVNVPFGLHFTEFSPMTDEGMKQLAHLKNLTFLHLSYTKVTAEGLKQLAGLKKLRRLEIENAKIDDATLRVLREIGLLHTLAGANFNPVDTEREDDRNYWDSADDVKRFALVTAKQVTDVGVKELAVFKNLENLCLADTAVTGTGLRNLAKLEKLTTLTMSKATDEGLKGVARLKSLTSLTIYSFSDVKETQAEVTDDGLQELVALKKLTELKLYYCPKVTAAGVAALKKSMPDCKIEITVAR